jgi:CRP-like cAMP-binding protein
MDQPRRARATTAGSIERPAPNGASAGAESGSVEMPPHATRSTAARLEPLSAGNLLGTGIHGVRTSRVKKGRDVVISGFHSRCIYVNHDGWLVRYKILRNGSRQVVNFILPGEVFGLPACLFQRALYSVSTITEVRLSTVPFDVVDDIFEQRPEVARALFWSTACEAAILGEHLIDAARRSAYQRVSHLLLELFGRLSRGHFTGEMTFAIPLTQELIADALGLSAVHVNRTLRALREDKLIAMNGRSITILDFEALSSLVDFEGAYLSDVARSLIARRPGA